MFYGWEIRTVLRPSVHANGIGNMGEGSLSNCQYVHLAVEPSVLEALTTRPLMTVRSAPSPSEARLRRRDMCLPSASCLESSQSRVTLGPSLLQPPTLCCGWCYFSSATHASQTLLICGEKVKPHIPAPLSVHRPLRYRRTGHPPSYSVCLPPDAPSSRLLSPPYPHLVILLLSGLLAPVTPDVLNSF